MKNKKAKQLGMNPSTASHRLVKDTMWRLIGASGMNQCYRCGVEMTRETFSIEHKEAWLDSEDPLGLYFDQSNIAFSHLRCNIQDSRTRPAAVCGTQTKYNKYGCRCDPCKQAKSKDRAKTYTKEGRQDRYRRTGK